MTLPDRFWKKVDKNGPVPAHRPELGPCRLWLGALDSSGYGEYYVRGSMLGAHRVAFEDLHEPVPEGLELDHLCRVRRCCNDAHVEPVTGSVNALRGISANREKTHCPQGHEYNEKNTYRVHTKAGRILRSCRPCNNARSRNRKKERHGTERTIG